MSKTEDIIAAYFRRKHSQHTAGLFGRWFLSSIDREAKDDALNTEWENIDHVADSTLERSYKSTLGRIEAMETIENRLLRRKAFAHRCRSAAAVLIPAAVIVIVLTALLWHNTAPTPVMKEYSAGYGEVLHITLPDSSSVVLNAGSVLICPEKFAGATREVYINGEASFDVAKDAKHPFIVRSADMSIEALGTLFNVSSYCDNHQVYTTLQHGRVKVELNKGGEAIYLDRNEQAVFDRSCGTFSKCEVEAAEFFAWEEGKLYFRDESVHDIIPVIERRFGVEINLTTNRYDNDRITAKFIYGETLEELLETFTHIVPRMKYRMDNNIVYLY